MSGENDFKHFKDRMQSFRASDEAREHFVSVRRVSCPVACLRCRPC